MIEKSYGNKMSEQQVNYASEARKMLTELIDQWNTGEDGGNFSFGSQDFNYIRALQRERLQKKHVKIIGRYKPSTDKGQRDSDKSVSFSSDDVSPYRNAFLSYVRRSKEIYTVDGKRKKTVHSALSFNVCVTWLLRQETDTPYCCPNCGAATMLSQLVQGCPYCGTRFVMNQLFPKITNLYTSATVDSAPLIWPLFIILALVFVCMGGLSLVINGTVSAPPWLMTWLTGILYLLVMLLQVVMFVFFFGVVGVFIIKKANEHPYTVRDKTSCMNLTQFVQSFDHSFSVDYFKGQLVTMVSTLVYSDDLDNVAIYEGAPRDRQADDMGDIVDMNFQGYLDLKDCYVKDNYLFINLDVYMQDIYCRSGTLKRQNDIFNLWLCRNINAQSDYGSSVHAIACPNCGGSFDATREKNCPYCKTDYAIIDHDWVVLNFMKIKR